MVSYIIPSSNGFLYSVGQIQIFLLSSVVHMEGCFFCFVVLLEQ